MEETTYRRNVAAILINGKGEILIAERIGVPGAWQFPQGGADEGETDEQTLAREIEEELGLDPSKYKIVEKRDGYQYRFPGGKIKKGRFHGQDQAYFLCRFLGTDADIDLDAHKPEFGRFCWIPPERFRRAWLPPFKRDVYAAVLRDFFGVGLRG